MMKKKAIVFRFDIDTEPCLTLGTPALLDIFSEYKVNATFFVNMGRAVSWRMLLKRFIIDREKHHELVGKLTIPMHRKIGVKGMLDILLRNPKVGGSHPLILRKIIEAGHELGLHGGRSHGLWQWGAHRLSERQLAAEVKWGIAMLRRHLDYPLYGFSSPGWNSPDPLPCLIEKEGFAYLADSHKPNVEGAYYDNRMHSFCLNTNLTGEPGGVGFFESVVAHGGDAKTVRDLIREKAKHFSSLVLYDHPAFSGGAGLPLVKAALDTCLEDEIEILPARALLLKAGHETSRGR